VVSKSNHKLMALNGSTERLDLSSSRVAEVRSKGEHVFTFTFLLYLPPSACRLMPKVKVGSDR